MFFEFGMKSEKGFVCVLLLAYLYLLSTKVAARRQKELLCAMAFQELEWHAIDDVDFDFDENQVDISEIAPKSGTPVIEDIQPIWSSD